MTPDPARLQRLQALFEQAVALPAGDRDAFVAALSGDDAAFAPELARLLAADARGDDTVHALVGGAAEAVLAGGVDAAHRARIGRRYGAWRIVEHLADGGMGAVYRVERDDGQYSQTAALKLLQPARGSAEAAARLVRERQILARLVHPHIARLLDGGVGDDGVPYLVMEFVEGRPIDAWCHEQGLDTAARLRLMLPVCDAVGHAHRQLVVHRDLKPSNILVDADGRPKLLDFGIARLLEPDGPGLTRGGEQPLTPSHAAPEQITGGDITTATDVYALGVLLYDLLTGRLPHADATASPAELARAIVERDPPRPSEALRSAGTAVTSPSSPTGPLGSRRLAELQRRGERLTPERLARELEGDLDNIVLMALRKEPGRRYASVAEFADDLRRHLEHRPVRARPDTPGYRLKKLAERHPVALPATVAALLLAVGGSAAFTWRLAEERDRAVAAEAQARTAEAQARKAASFSAGVLSRTSAADAGQREVPVLELLGTAVERSGRELADEPRVGAEVDLALGQALSSWGAYDRALEVLKRGRSRAREAGIGDDPERLQARALEAQAVALHDLGRLDEALVHTREADAIWQRIGTPAERAESTLNIAMGLNSLRRRDEAEPVFREAIAALRAAHGGDHDDLAFALNNLAWGLHARGRLDEAQPHYEEALAMQRRLGLNFADLGQTLNNLAGLHFDRGELDRADALWREVLQGYETLYGPEGHAAVIRAYSMATMVPMLRGEHDEALALAARAAAANTRMLGERHRWTATTINNHGVALLGAGRVEEAGAELRRSMAIRREVLPPGHPDLVPSHLALARQALAAGRPREAERELREAERIAAALPGPGRLRMDLVALELGRALAAQGRADEARAAGALAAERAAARYADGDWRRVAIEALVALPPFAAEPDAGARERGRSALALLRERLGPAAPLAQDVEAALRNAG